MGAEVIESPTSQDWGHRKLFLLIQKSTFSGSLPKFIREIQPHCRQSWIKQMVRNVLACANAVLDVFYLNTYSSVGVSERLNTSRRIKLLSIRRTCGSADRYSL